MNARWARPKTVAARDAFDKTLKSKKDELEKQTKLAPKDPKAPERERNGSESQSAER